MANHRIALILDNIRSTFNVGSIFRSADCFGVDHVYIAGITPYPLRASDDTRLPHIANKLHAQIAKTALGAEQRIAFSVDDSTEQAVLRARNDGYSIIALEQSAKSQPLHHYIVQQPTAIVLGTEVSGLDASTLALCDAILEIEQYGTKESLNVASAAAIALYALRTQEQT